MNGVLDSVKTLIVYGVTLIYPGVNLTLTGYHFGVCTKLGWP